MYLSEIETAKSSIFIHYGVGTVEIDANSEVDLTVIILLDDVYTYVKNIKIIHYHQF